MRKRDALCVSEGGLWKRGGRRKLSRGKGVQKGVWGTEGKRYC